MYIDFRWIRSPVVYCCRCIWRTRKRVSPILYWRGTYWHSFSDPFLHISRQMYTHCMRVRVYLLLSFLHCPPTNKAHACVCVFGCACVYERPAILWSRRSARRRVENAFECQPFSCSTNRATPVSQLRAARGPLFHIYYIYYYTHWCTIFANSLGLLRQIHYIL